MKKRFEKYRCKSTGKLVDFYFSQEDRKYISEDGRIRLTVGWLMKRYELFERVTPKTIFKQNFRTVVNINGFKIRERIREN